MVLDTQTYASVFLKYLNRHQRFFEAFEACKYHVSGEVTWTSGQEQL
jgi:hypothetical protein